LNSTRERFDRVSRTGDRDIDLAGAIDDRAVEAELGGEPPP
jgi:hypothetical protein